MRLLQKVRLSIMISSLTIQLEKHTTAVLEESGLFGECVTKKCEVRGKL